MSEPHENDALARELHEQIIDLGERRELLAILEIVGDPSNGHLLEQGPASSRRRAQSYIGEAERWVEKRREANTRRLAEARRALEGLDLQLARGLMNRIDGRFLSDGQQDERDRLLLDISARSMELESLSETGDRLMEETEGSERPWWRRWLG
jgi:hypothetical protein